MRPLQPRAEHAAGQPRLPGRRHRQLVRRVQGERGQRHHRALHGGRHRGRGAAALAAELPRLLRLRLPAPPLHQHLDAALDGRSGVLRLRLQALRARVDRREPHHHHGPARGGNRRLQGDGLRHLPRLLPLRRDGHDVRPAASRAFGARGQRRVLLPRQRGLRELRRRGSAAHPQVHPGAQGRRAAVQHHGVQRHPHRDLRPHGPHQGLERDHQRPRRHRLHRAEGRSPVGSESAAVGRLGQRGVEARAREEVHDPRDLGPQHQVAVRRRQGHRVPRAGAPPGVQPPARRQRVPVVPQRSEGPLPGVPGVAAPRRKARRRLPAQHQERSRLRYRRADQVPHRRDRAPLHRPPLLAREGARPR